MFQAMVKLSYLDKGYLSQQKSLISLVRATSSCSFGCVFLCGYQGSLTCRKCQRLSHYLKAVIMVCISFYSFGSLSEGLHIMIFSNLNCKDHIEFQLRCQFIFKDHRTYGNWRTLMNVLLRDFIFGPMRTHSFSTGNAKFFQHQVSLFFEDTGDRETYEDLRLP